VKNVPMHIFVSRLTKTFPLGFQIILYIIVTIIFIENGIAWGVFSIFIAIAFCYFYKINIWLFFILLILSGFQFQEKINNKTIISNFYNKKLLIEGWITNYPKIKDSIKVEAKINIESVDYKIISKGINLMIESSLQKPEFNMFDKILCYGILKEEEDFEKEYFKSENLYGRIVCDEVEIINIDSNVSVIKAIVDYKTYLVGITKTNLNQPYSDLLLGMVFGDDVQMSSHLYDDIKNSGIAHVIAASGYNINLVVSLAFIFNKYLNRTKLVILSDLLLMVGLDNIPAKRAIIMQIYLTTAWIFGKKANIYYSLSICLLLLFFENIYVYKSLSFLLTFVATIGIILFFKPLRNLINKIIKDLWLCEAIAISTVSTIATIPVLSVFFGKVSAISVFSNILIAPLIPLIFYSGFGFLILISIGIQSMFLNFVIYCMLEIFIKIIDLLGGLNFSTFKFNTNIYIILLPIGVILIFWFLNLFKKKYYG